MSEFLTSGEASPTWDAGLLERASEELTAYIGPMGGVLVDRTAKQARNRKELCEGLSAKLPAEQREQFLAALGVK